MGLHKQIDAWEEKENVSKVILLRKKISREMCCKSNVCSPLNARHECSFSSAQILAYLHLKCHCGCAHPYSIDTARLCSITLWIVIMAVRLIIGEIRASLFTKFKYRRWDNKLQYINGKNLNSTELH